MSLAPQAIERPWRQTRVRAPRNDESCVADPPLESAAQMARANAAQLAGASLTLLGKSLSDLRAWTRREAWRAAQSYTTALRDADGADSARSAAPTDALWFVGGHQPELFHPGVWVKNFVVGALARAERGVGLNLVVDNDIVSATSIRVPVGTRDEPQIQWIPFDEPRAGQPWEEARILNPELFRTFPQRVEGVLSGWGFQPLLREFWKL
ncbi:MAG: hypothetical protein ACKV0T_31430, partial [Planctomycetales bacterium]